MTNQGGPVDHVVTSGTFSLDGGTWEVENNVWIVGDENEAQALSDRFDAPVLLNPAEAPLWEMTHPDRKPDRELADGDVPCPATRPSALGTATRP